MTDTDENLPPLGITVAMLSASRHISAILKKMIDRELLSNYYTSIDSH